MGIIGIILAWPVVGVAYLPLAILVLLKADLLNSFITALLGSSFVLGSSLLLDSIYYGKITASKLNIKKKK